MKLNHSLRAAAALLALALPSAVFAQAGAAPPPAPAPAAAAGVRIGILDVRGAIVGSAEGKLAQAELQSQFSPRQNEIETLRKQIEDIQRRLQSAGNTMSDEEKARLARQGDSLSRIYQRRTDDLREDLQAAENEVLDRIGRKMRDVLDRYGRENGFTVIFNVSGQDSIVYATNQVDVTQDIIRLYDAAHPVKAGAATPQPARPATQPGTPRPQTKPPQQ